jgi:hypothetical protein
VSLRGDEKGKTVILRMLVVCDLHREGFRRRRRSTEEVIAPETAGMEEPAIDVGSFAADVGLLSRQRKCRQG